VCVCERESVKESQGHTGLDGKTPGLEARAQVHHGRQWKALQKVIGLSLMLASVAWTLLHNSPLITPPPQLHRGSCLSPPSPVCVPLCCPATFDVAK